MSRISGEMIIEIRNREWERMKMENQDVSRRDATQ